MLTCLPLLLALAPNGCDGPDHLLWMKAGDPQGRAVRLAEGVGETWVLWANDFGPFPGPSALGAYATATGDELLSVPLPPEAYELAVARDVSRAVVLLPEQGGVRVQAFESSSTTPLWTLDDPDGSWSAKGQVHVSADGSVVLVHTRSGPDDLLLLDGATGSVIAQTTTIGAFATLSADGARAIAAVTGGTIEVLSLPSLTPEVALPGGRSALSDDGHVAVSYGFLEFHVYERDGAGNWTSKWTLDVPSVPRDWALSGDGSTLAYALIQAGEMFSVDLSTGQVVGNVVPDMGAEVLAISAPGTRIALLPEQTGQVFSYDRELNLVACQDVLDGGEDVDISSDGARFAVSGFSGNLLQTGRVTVFDLVSPKGYCVPKISSQACITLLQATSPGPVLAGAGDVAVRADFVQATQPGLFFYGTSGPAAIPFLGESLCVLPPLIRTPIQLSGGTVPGACDGVFQIGVNGGTIDPLPGTTIWLQAWYRDPGGGVGIFGSALSNGIELTLQ